MKVARKGEKLFFNLVTIIMLVSSVASLAYGIYIIAK
jgi:hypothetical protein